MQTHTSQRGLACSYPFPKQLHPCSCDRHHWMEQAISKAQQRKRTEQRQRTQESLNPVPPALSPVQAVLTKQLATPADLLAGHCILHPSQLAAIQPFPGIGHSRAFVCLSRPSRSCTQKKSCLFAEKSAAKTDARTIQPSSPAMC